MVSVLMFTMVHLNLIILGVKWVLKLRTPKIESDAWHR
jgi:hypothetical protein